MMVHDREWGIDVAKKKGRKPYRGGNASKRELMLKFCGYNLDQAANRTAAIYDVMDLFFGTLHKSCKLGKDRLRRVFDKMIEYQLEIHCGTFSYADMNLSLEQDTHVPLDREEAKKRMSKRSNIGKIQYRVVDELSTLLLAAMHDVCGYDAKILVALYQAIADMSDCPDYGKLETELKQAGFDVRRELSGDHARAAFFGTYKLGQKKGLDAR